jgi:hypothetical protein
MIRMPSPGDCFCRTLSVLRIAGSWLRVSVLGVERVSVLRGGGASHVLSWSARSDNASSASQDTGTVVAGYAPGTSRAGVPSVCDAPLGMEDDQDTAGAPPIDPMTLVLVLYTFRLVHGWIHDLPTDEIRADLIAAASAHRLWRAEYETDSRMIPGAEPTGGPDDAGPRPLTLVE